MDALTPTEAPVEIEELREAGEDGGDLMGYFARGHVPAYRFAEAANAYSGADTSWDRRHVQPQDVRHVWWRTVPIAGEPGCSRFVAADPGSRGAYQATLADVLIRRQHREMYKAMREADRRHSVGFADGVGWVLRLLQFQHQEAGELVEAAWKSGAGERAYKQTGET